MTTTLGKLLLAKRPVQSKLYLNVYEKLVGESFPEIREHVSQRQADLQWQATISAVERCRAPVLGSYHPPPMDIEMQHKFARFNHYNKRGATDDMMMENFRLSTTQEKAREFIQRGYRALDWARSVLIWSYPCAYFMEQGSQELNHFEICQGNLEIVTEKIAGITERYNWESLDVFEHFVCQVEKHTDILLRRVDTFSA